MEKYLGKKYVLKSSDKLDEYLKFVGIGFITRKAATAVTHTICLTKNEDGSYTFTVGTSIKNVSFTFRLGEEFVDARADGLKVKSVITFEEDTMLQTQTEDNGRVSRHVRRFSPDTVVGTTTVDGWPDTCVRTYELVK